MLAVEKLTLGIERVRPKNIPSNTNIVVGAGGGSLGTPGRTVRDYEDTFKEMKKENFNLKLRYTKYTVYTHPTHFAWRNV